MMLNFIPIMHIEKHLVHTYTFKHTELLEQAHTL